MSRAVLAGEASGVALVLDEPLSMWGGIDTGTGRIIDRRHPQSGDLVSDRILFLPWGRGSSSASAVLAEAIRLGTGPAAIVMMEPDEILLVGALVAAELYGTVLPIVVTDRSTYNAVATGDKVTVHADGAITIG